MEDKMYKNFVFSNIIDYIRNWTWQELFVGVEESIITVKNVVEYAKYIIAENVSDYEIVLSVIIAERDDEIMELVSSLTKGEKATGKQIILDKWRYAILLDLYFKKEKYINVYEQIALISGDFRNTEDMNSFIYYMRTNGIASEANWVNYLIEQSKRFGVDISL